MNNNNNNTPNFSGVNFCPCCGTNVRAVAMAMRLTDPEPPKPAPKPASTPSVLPRANGKRRRMLISEETSAEIVRRKERGETNFAIGQALGIKEATVHSHLRRAREKLELNRMTQTNQT